MDLNQTKAGTRLMLDMGAIAEVVAVQRGGRQARVRYVDAPFEPELVGSEADVRAEQVVGLDVWGRLEDPS